MTIVKMSVHRALAEIKLLTSRIDKAMTVPFVVANKMSNKVISGQTVDEVRSMLSGNLDSVIALIKNRKLIKAALVLSNAETLVNIGGLLYTVAGAIEYKASITIERKLLMQLKNQLNTTNAMVDKQNDMLPSKLETYLVSVLGDKGSRTAEDVKSLTKLFEDQNKYELVDPNKLNIFITKFEKELDEFESQVDYILSESNATTFVDVDLA